MPDPCDNGTPIEENCYLTDLLSRRSAQIIEQRPAEQPFLRSLHYSAPHWPWLARNNRAESQRIGGFGKHTDGGSFEAYQRMIHHMDEGIGWV